MITVQHLTKKYGNTSVVDDVSFSLTENRCVALIGPNGAGKTTTLRMLTGLMKATSGNISFSEDNNLDIREKIGYLPQQPTFHNWMTGQQFLIYCAKLYRFSKTNALQRAEELLTRVGLSDAKNKRISTYSGGMKQRLGIAQAILHSPKLLLLDEPVSALDPIGRREVLTLMEELKQEMTILFSTHILNDADEISDELLLLHEGRMLESGDMNTLRKKYETAMIELQFEANAEVYANALMSLNTVNDLSIVRNTIHLSVTKVDQARTEILQHCTDNNWPLTSFSVNKASLEDMFMKVVQSCNG
ncbi:MAG TPA: ABC transporter ATP-binding protein [Pseudogracilibacillus sp.]|nr:ABC transporter ATP-binding protein [Pseudogracilibacillus sp.]